MDKQILSLIYPQRHHQQQRNSSWFHNIQATHSIHHYVRKCVPSQYHPYIQAEVFCCDNMNYMTGFAKNYTFQTCNTSFQGSE